jgi:hypothetical protein
MRMVRQVCTAVLGGLIWTAALGTGVAQTVTTRVSTDAVGAQVAGASRQPSVSADGRFVAFSSTATTLVAADGNGSADVFVKDRLTGVVTRVSVRTGGAEATGDSVAPDISNDGRYVTFASAAALTADDTNAVVDVFRHDRSSGATVRVSVSTSGTQANGASAAPRLNGDGRYVVFESVATNLVAGDDNLRRDIFLRDLQTSVTSRVSVATNGGQSDRDATAPTISDDGARIAFLSDSTTIDADADPLPCDAVVGCTRAFVREVAGGTTVRLPLAVPYFGRPADLVELGFRVTTAVIAPDGQSVTANLYGMVSLAGTPSSYEAFSTHWFTPGSAPLNAVPGGILASGFVRPPIIGPLAVSANGRMLAFCIATDSPPRFAFSVFERLTWAGDSLFAAQPDCEGVAVTADGLTGLFASSGSTLVAGDTNAAFDVFAFDMDGDNDGMSSAWETFFRLDDGSAADATADTDGDGITNAEEFAAGTHPRGLFTYYLAEGAENAFFDTEIAVFNPSLATTGATSVIGQFLGQNGRRTVGPILNTGLRANGSGMLLYGEQIWSDILPLPDQAFSTLIESEQPLAVERTMTWGGGPGAGYGSHAERAISGPASTWYFAEGATHGAFDLFYLLQNPSDLAATATITYLLPAPQVPITRTYALAPNSRRTIYVDEEPGLSATDVSARIDADRPIFAERAMYMTANGEAFAGGTASAGITTPGTQWFIAEGATGSFFDLFILIGNASPSAATVAVTYLLPNGSTVEKTYQVPGQSRRTISVKSEDTRLAATAVSATITSTNGVPIVVERAMWWPSPLWYEGTVTAATTASAARWALAGGFVDASPEAETYLLVANPGTLVANVTFTVGANGAVPTSQNPNVAACQVTVAVPARGRYTTGLKGLCPAMAPTNITGRIRVAGTIESDGPPIVVERSTYWSANGQFWAAGASTLLTPLP